MKRLIFFFLFSHLSHAQWQPDVRLTNNSGVSALAYNNGRSIASSGDTLHVVWYDSRDGNSEVYYKRSVNRGVSWGSDTRLTNAAHDSFNPSVAVSAQLVHVVWFDFRDGNFEIYYKRSTDGGGTWGADTRLTINAGQSGYPSIFASGLVLHVVFGDDRHGGVREMYYIRSTDGGITWGAETRLTNDPADTRHPTVSASGSLVHVVFIDARDGNYEVYYKRSSDGGLSWGTDTRLTNTSTPSEYPMLSSSGSVVHVLWKDGTSTANIFYKRSTDGGLSWESDRQLTNNTATTAIFPSMALYNANVHLVWQDSRDGNKEIYYKQSSDEGGTWGTDSRLTNNSASSESPFVAVSGSAIHVVWQDNRNANFEIYYKVNPTGNPTDVKNISSEVPKNFSLEQNYPNPFNPSTTIGFQVPTKSHVTLTLLDVMGREVITLINETKPIGQYDVVWNAGNFASGMYFYRITAGDFVSVKKLVLLR